MFVYRPHLFEQDFSYYAVKFMYNVFMLTKKKPQDESKLCAGRNKANSITCTFAEGISKTDTSLE